MTIEILGEFRGEAYVKDTKTSQTSLESWDSINQNGTRKIIKLRVLELIQKHPEGKSRNDISRELRMAINAVTRAVYDLINDGTIHEFGSKIDVLTKKRNYILKIR